MTSQLDFYNTIHLEGLALSREQANANTQQGRVLQWFREHPEGGTPWAVWDSVFQRGAPITSVRRSITNLAKAGHLVKTEGMVMGEEGLPCHVLEARMKDHERDAIKWAVRELARLGVVGVNKAPEYVVLQEMARNSAERRREKKKNEALHTLATLAKHGADTSSEWLARIEKQARHYGATDGEIEEAKDD